MTLHVDSNGANSSRRYCTGPSRTFETDALERREPALRRRLWAKKAREEHDAFAQALRDKGVKVHLFGDLFTDVLATVDGRAFVLDTLITDDEIGPRS